MSQNNDVIRADQENRKICNEEASRKATQVRDLRSEWNKKGIDFKSWKTRAVLHFVETYNRLVERGEILQAQKLLTIMRDATKKDETPLTHLPLDKCDSITLQMVEDVIYVVKNGKVRPVREKFNDKDIEAARTAIDIVIKNSSPGIARSFANFIKKASGKRYSDRIFRNSDCSVALTGRVPSSSLAGFASTSRPSAQPDQVRSPGTSESTKFHDRVAEFSRDH